MAIGKEILATDIDEVLFPFAEEFALWHNQEYGTNLTLDDFISYDFEHVLQVEVPEVVHRVHSFLSQDHGHLDVRPLEEAEEGIVRLAEVFDLKAITARHPGFEQPTKQYLLQYFRDISGLTLVGHKETMKVLRTKAEICKEIGARALIDDSVHHVTVCAQQGIEGVLYGKYWWNDVEELPSGVVRCLNWPSVLDHFGVSR